MEESYKLVAEHATDLLSHIDQWGRFVYVSPSYRAVLGYVPEELIGSWAYEITHPEDVPLILSAMQEGYKPGGRFSFTSRARHKDGHWIWLETQAAVIKSAKEDLLIGIVSASRDVTERMLREQEARNRESELVKARDLLAAQATELMALAANLTLARQQADAANRAKSQFLATMSHELRTPLNAIMGFSEIIKGELLGPVTEPRYKEYAGDIYDSGRHLLAILNDILDLAKIEAGRLDLQIGWFGLDEVLSDVAKLIRGPMMERRLTLDVSKAQVSGSIFADSRAVKQILLNLLSNSVKFSEPGKRIWIGAQEHGRGGLKFWVTDEGIGIPPAMLQRVFEPFEQVDSQYARQSGGTGLGLTLVRALADLHGGRVEIESELGKGTTVTVTLPGMVEGES